MSADPGARRSHDGDDIRSVVNLDPEATLDGRDKQAWLCACV